MKLVSIWAQAFAKKRLIFESISGLIMVFIALSTIRVLLVYNEARQGFAFDDPVLRLITPRDLTWTIFILIYFFLVWGIYLILHDVKAAIVWAHAYSIMILIRCICLFLLPLEPPIHMIFLKDPIVSIFTWSATPVKDLFFSGHTATSFLVYLGVRNTKYANIFLFATVLIGYGVLAQHVHYSIDVLAAPFFAYFSYKLANRLINDVDRILDHFS